MWLLKCFARIRKFTIPLLYFYYFYFWMRELSVRGDGGRRVPDWA
jgi:hypothetical protein